jgi:hypothetical protein
MSALIRPPTQPSQPQQSPEVVPAGGSAEESPVYVNAKQLHRIIKRRIARQKLDDALRLTSKRRKPYLHESRHNHAMKFTDGDDDFQARGRTPEREVCSPRAGSRASSSSSVRSMIDERLEWAHQDRIRSASRRGSVQKSPSPEHSPFYAEYSGAWNVPEPPSSIGRYICECCPEMPRRFHTLYDPRYVPTWLSVGCVLV